MGSNWEYLGFSSDENDNDLLGVCVLGQSVKIKVWNASVQEDCEHLMFTFVFTCMVAKCQQNPNTLPQLDAPMADNSISQDRRME